MTPAAVDELLRKITALTVDYVDHEKQITDEQFDDRLRAIVAEWAAGQSQWIRCPDRLPNDMEYKLIRFDDGKVYGAKYSDGNWWDPDGLDFNYGADVPVEWMEIPK